MWRPVAGRAAVVRIVEDRLQPASPLVRRRHPDWTIGVDGAVVRAHQHAAGARHEPPADIPAEVVATTELDTGGRVE